MNVNQVIATIANARSSLETARRAYDQLKTAGVALTSQDEEQIKASLASLQTEYDNLHSATQKKLRGK